MRRRKPAAPRVRVWDLPTRMFHWTLVGLVGCSWLSADRGWLELHLWSGSLVLTLLLFRIGWGIMGSTTARFSQFLRKPREIAQYWQNLAGGRAVLYAGHNPLGGLMVAAFITVLLAQTVTGLFANDGLRIHGPLALWVSAEISDRLTSWHEMIFNLILVMIWAHLVAIFFYRLVKGQDLVKPMLTGEKPRASLPVPLQLEFVHWKLAVVVLAAAAALVSWIWS